MNSLKLFMQNSNLKPFGEEFNNLIKHFLSSDFVINEANLVNFLTKLHNLDYQNKYNNLYTIKAYNDILSGGNTNHTKKEIDINTSDLLNISSNAKPETVMAYKIQLLCAYFHETKHEKQYDVCMRDGFNGAFNKVMTYEFSYVNEVYNQFNSLCEIDARLYSLKRIIDLQKQKVLPSNPEYYILVVEELLNLVEGINNITVDNYTYDENPISHKRLLKKILTDYSDYSTIYRFHSREFLSDFKKEFEYKIGSFFNKEYRQFIFNNILKMKLNDEIREKFNISKENEQSQWTNLFLQYFVVPDRYFLANFSNLKSDELIKDAGLLTITEQDVIDFLKYKNIKPTERNIALFYNDDSRHKEFEEYLKNKNNIIKQDDGYNALLSAIFGEKEN